MTLLIVASFISMISNHKNNIAKAATIEQYEKQISVNNNTIAQYEEIKTQLHYTAELIRQSVNFNTEFVGLLSQKWHDYNDSQEELKNNNEYVSLEIKKIKQKKRTSFLGYFTITHYCIENYPHICNNGDASTTATGTTPTPGRTIAVDSRKIPYYTKVLIDGNTYTAEDTGGGIRGNKIDICVSTHSEAIEKGTRRNVPVYIVTEN